LGRALELGRALVPELEPVLEPAQGLAQGLARAQVLQERPRASARDWERPPRREAQAWVAQIPPRLR
jgi:hypothetical protein